MNRHRRRFVAVLALLIAPACTTDSDSNAESSEKAEAQGAKTVEKECDFRTPLVPGVPGSPGHLIQSSRNPNGDSELAHLMREMVDDLTSVRTKLAAGQPVPKLFPRQRKIRCSWPTDANMRDEAFDQRARQYLDAVQAFDRAPGQATYNTIVARCISCHTVSCQGPLDMIAGLGWK